MKRTVVWKNRFILFGMIVMALLFISGCSGDDLTPVSGNELTTPWAATATEDTWLTANPFGDKHDGGWVYSAREDRFYAMYGNDNSGRNLYRIDHIGQSSSLVDTYAYGRHGSHPVIDDTGTYIYQPPSCDSSELERYNTVTDTLETLATAPNSGCFSQGAWKNGKLWITLDDDNLYSYDPATNEWSDSLHTFSSSSNVASSGTGSNLIYILEEGGALFSYNVTNDAVTPLASDPHGYPLGGNGQFTWFGISNGFLYAIGSDGGSGYIPAIYDIVNDTWHDLSDPKDNVDYAGHATWDSNRKRLYVTGDDDGVWYYQY